MGQGCARLGADAGGSNTRGFPLGAGPAKPFGGPVRHCGVNEGAGNPHNAFACWAGFLFASHNIEQWLAVFSELP